MHDDHGHGDHTFEPTNFVQSYGAGKHVAPAGNCGRLFFNSSRAHKNGTAVLGAGNLQSHRRWMPRAGSRHLVSTTPILGCRSCMLGAPRLHVHFMVVLLASVMLTLAGSACPGHCLNEFSSSCQVASVDFFLLAAITVTNNACQSPPSSMGTVKQRC